MIRVYRISKPAYVATSLSGQGSALYPGRWNSQGVRLAYTAGSVALAMLEMLVHVDKEDVPVGQRLLSFDIPEDAVADLDILPAGWDQLPYSAAVRAAGDDWIAAASSLGLRVPSAVARHEWNVLLNPAHPRIGNILPVADEDLVLDPRLFE
ncbi:RES family NAD+ phosphorylase [Variovorax paradoxus]|jgi:RES domain-containing protein|uniref:RES family NAD+ phosphorylase n=1 Tax=Variovorax paradoxus TaxID=34073 RepID=UPI0029C7FA5A|nr:RES family NAD+ phosphorylase [Variovorax paradoxus]WPH23917.1 RES family NAD+ phosphorylase [Variovorax paradoxus]